MARKKKKQSVDWLRIMKIFVLGVVIISSVFALTRWLLSAVREASLFEVREIVHAPSLKFVESRYLDQLVGKSIFEVDLEKVQVVLQRQYPEIDRLKIVRRFPDQLLLVAKKREPQALIETGAQDILVDEDAVVLAVADIPRGEWPIITGVSIYKTVMLGKPIRDRRLLAGLRIIQGFRGHQALAARKLLSIDVTSLSKIIVRDESGMEIIMDVDSLSAKISGLALVLSEASVNFDNYQYIDMRFKEPILGQK